MDAQTKFHAGNLNAALASADENYRQLESIDARWSWKFRILEAEILLWKGTPEEAFALLGSNPPAGSPNDTLVRRRILQGRALCALGRTDESASFLHQAEGLLGPDQRDLQSELAFARGKCSVDPTVALAYYRQTVTSAHGVDPFVEANALVYVGYFLLQEKHYGEAIDSFKEGLGLSNSLLLIREKALGNLGFGYSQLGDWKKAIAFSQQAEAGAQQIKNAADQKKWLIDLGKAHYALWELQDADNSYLRALALAQQGGDRDDTALCFHNLALNALRKQELDKAEDYVRQGESIGSVREQVHLALDRAEIASAREHWAEAEALFGSLESNPKTEPLIRVLAQRDLGKAYWHDRKIAQADRMFRKGIGTLEAAISQIKGEEDRLSFLDQERFYDAYIAFLVAQDRPAEALQIAERGRAQTLSDSERRRQGALAVPAVQRLLKRRNEVVLVYWVTDDESFVWAVAPSGFRVFKLPGHRDLQLTIEAYNHELQEHRNPKDSPAGQKLYELLIRPAEELISTRSDLIIVPSKILSWLSFEALVVPGPQPHYWIEDVSIELAGAVARIPLAEQKARVAPKRRNQLLLLGAPVEVSKDFPALKDAPEEMRRVQSHFAVDRRTVVSGNAATPQAYSASRPGEYQWIHLDTHGTASDLSPLDSAIILAPGAKGAYKLYAREIKNIPIDADLVTISACYGAGTRWYNNEGVVGLGWAFLRAGARQVIAGLWEADGAATAQLMDDFYGELTSGKSAAEALRNAKLKMLHSNTFYRHPYYWASLQLYTGS